MVYRQTAATSVYIAVYIIAVAVQARTIVAAGMRPLTAPTPFYMQASIDKEDIVTKHFGIRHMILQWFESANVIDI